MEKDLKYYEMLVNEAFIRRAVAIDFPFMLKGSYITRQYFEKPIDRIPNDLDFVYLHHLNTAEKSEIIFTEWATLVTELDLEDGVKFESFQKNCFWRLIDYAMDDDFPTVNTDLVAVVDGKNVDISLDISFNLDIDQEPIPLLYQPLEGEPFYISQTPPISLQVAWKVHQCLVRPRFKDMFDLIHLLNREEFANSHNVSYTLQTLVNECHRDKIDVRKMKFLIEGDLETLYQSMEYGNLKLNLHKEWKGWRNEDIIYSVEKIYYITSQNNVSNDVFQFAKELKNAFKKAGFMIETLDKLPKPKLL